MKKILNSVILAAFLAACTDYVAQIDERYGEWETSAQFSSSETSVSSSSKVPELAEGTLTDTRDGKTYKTVTIGTQTWMAENLNYETTNSYCYDDNVSNCTKYGRLYTWAAAMDSTGTWSTNGKRCGYNKTCSPTYPVRGICPEGWHLPTKAEFETLFAAVGGKSTAGKMLKSTSGWNSSGNGTDAYAFSALPTGYWSYYGRFIYEGNTAYFWSSTENNSSNAYSMLLYSNNDYAGLSDYNKYYGFSVRCLKDEGEAVKSSSSVTLQSSTNETSVSSSSVMLNSSSSVTSQSSSSLTSVSSSSKVPEPAEGTLIDTRDGRAYKMVTIGSQTWMAENLNYETANSYCYNGTASNCTKYGRLYTWAVAMDSVGTLSTNGKGCGYGTICSPTYPVRGICPEGWHLPTEEEFETLFTAVGGQSTAGKMLKSTSGWNSSGNGTDAYAFSALPAGYRDYDGKFNHEGNLATFWCSTEYDSNNASSMDLYYFNDEADLVRDGKDRAFSVRCLKD